MRLLCCIANYHKQEKSCCFHNKSDDESGSFFVLHALGRFLSEWERMFAKNSTKI